MANVSTRTLRYYDEIGLLVPKRKSKNNYRLYNLSEIDRLQQILFFRELEIPLEQIRKIVTDQDFDPLATLEAHQAQLIEKQKRLNQLLENLDQTIAYHKGEKKMKDIEKFRGFKQTKLAENEQRFGKELRARYGEEVVEQANQKFLNFSHEEYEEMEKIERQLFEQLSVYHKQPTEILGKQVAQLHKQWLQYSWPTYSVEAHQGLALMYLADERFIDYYDSKVGEGATKALVECLTAYL